MSSRLTLRSVAFSVLLVAAVTTVKLLVPSIGRELPFRLYIFVVFLAALYGDRLAGLLATALSVFATTLFFLPPYGAFALTPQGFLHVCLFSLECVAISLFVSVMKATQANIARLQSATAAFSAARTPEDVARAVVQYGAEALDAGSAVFVWTSARGGPEVVAETGSLEPRFDVVRSTEVASSPLSRALHNGEPTWGGGGDTLSTSVTLPVKRGDEPFGALALRFAGRRRFTARRRSLALTLTSQASSALQRASLYVEESQARDHLQSIVDLSAALSTALERAAVAEVVVERGMQSARADTCTLYVIDERTGGLELIGDRGVAVEVIDRIRRIEPDQNHPTWRVLDGGKPIWAETEEEYHAFYPALAETKTSGPRAKAFWCVPLVVEGHPIGLLGMGFYAPRPFSSKERMFVEAFTRQCAQALRRAQRLRSELLARQAAEQARSSLATTMRSIGDAVIATDIWGKITFMNPVAQDLTGWDEAEARGEPLKTVFRIVNEATREEVESPVDKVLREGTVVGLANHTVLIGKDPTQETPIDDSGAPIRDESGVIQGVVLVFRSMSEEKKAEARRAFLGEASTTLFSSLDYRQTLARVAQLVVPRLADWCAIDVVEEGQALPERIAVAHVDPEKVALAHELDKRYPPDPNAKTGVPNVLRTGLAEFYPDISDEMLVMGALDEEHLRISRELQLRSALVVPLLIRGQVLGAVTLVYADSGRRYTEEDLAFATDFAGRAAIAVENARLYASEQREKEKADVANRAKDAFLATVSHELRTPLNAILGWAHMLAESNLSPEKQRRAIEVVERNAVSMAQLIEDLLDVSRIVSGKMQLTVGAVDVIQIIDGAMESARPAADAKEILIHRTLDPAASTIVADSTRLQQIVWNLLSNAVKFTPQGGRIDIGLRRVDSAVEIGVRDTGKGIDARFLPHVFEPFRQADGSLARAHGGLGLGLAITRHLVELHGGRIEVHSDGEGLGAAFVVRLPLSLTPQQMRVMLEKRPSPKLTLDVPPELKDLLVLVVDDEDDARQLVQEVLEQCGARVASARSVAQAMQMFELEIPDVLLSDIGMPTANGYELARWVRALPAAKGGKIPAAALTAFAGPEDRRTALEAGYLMHVPKPIDPRGLVGVVANLVRMARESGG